MHHGGSRFGAVIMDNQIARRPSARPSNRPSIRDLAVVTIAILGFIFANVGVVRALDLALDAIHR
jgi:hypothetical protein